MLNVFQLMTALLVDWLTITAGPPWPWMVAAPPTTVPAFGPGRRLRQAECQQRRGCEQQIAQAWMHRGVLLQPRGQDEGEARAVTPNRGKRFAYSRSGQELV